ncbi:hypothetical protein DVQ84_08850 [Yersinia enterocolitica]|nr:hypothetical protein [Yersinia enterocolitica]EKN6031524.1 hypothetical protein [Yersinia enterocolitica]EKN6069781.1 hypothetical protein [Yersinia enterocolitica]EKN6185679.1 hypothetical protein [Yersinia enterocolitica]EKN6189338.1 hypothetical protein [Yersinia enterocolitica]
MLGLHGSPDLLCTNRQRGPRPPCAIPRFARIACPLRGFPYSSFRLTERADSLLFKRPSLGVHASRPTSTLHSAAQMCF